MQIYKAPVQDMAFNLEAFGYDDLLGLATFGDFDRGSVKDILELCGRFATEQMLPLNRKGDEQGVTWDPETKAVTTPEGFKALFDQYVELGMLGMAMPQEYGGSGAPSVVAMLLNELTVATNKSFSMCPGLTHGLIDALFHYGTDEQKAKYLPKFISGEWSGTMCLTEPQCGTDLGLCKTKAVPTGDGSYALSGTKIWITFGEHDLCDNIVHLVLARLPDAPEGIKGISTFVVPKFLDDGTRNPVFCTGLEHKLGIHASPTCVISLEGAKGYLVGEPHRGMKTMFVMMNAARLGVAVEGIALGEIAYQTALEFAKDRRQMRALDPAKRDANESADTILVHPDVRRMLLNIKSTTEAMRGIAIWVAKMHDEASWSTDETVKQEANDLVALLTPVMKSYFTERGFQNVSDAMQVCGGAGYTTDWSIEQYMRDLRIALIYEGTNHIQALDLVGRKLPANGGRAMRTFAGKVTEAIKAYGGDEVLAPFVEELKAASKQVSQITMAMGGKAMKDPEEAGAAASNYLNLFALTVLAYGWVKQLALAKDKGGKFAETKFKTARYFFKTIMPERHTYAAIVMEGKQHMMAFDEDEF